jgi:hypothetical protein
MGGNSIALISEQLDRLAWVAHDTGWVDATASATAASLRASMPSTAES